VGRFRFVTPGTTRIDISDGDWIEVKSELDAGDQRKQDTLALIPTVVMIGDKEEVRDRVDWSNYEVLRTHLWLVDWSFTNKNREGKIVAVPVTVEAIRSLDLETFDEINDAIFQHIMKVIELKKTKKKAREQKEDVEVIST
jgi:hypothetical protein